MPSRSQVCRNEARGREAVDQVRQSSGNADVHLKLCDVSSLASIKTLVQDLRSSGTPVHMLVNNAGVMMHERQRSADGHDINFATNTLGCFALTYLLRDVLTRSAPSRVVFVTSGGMLTEPLDVEDLENERMGSKYDGTRAYAKDKRRQVRGPRPGRTQQPRHALAIRQSHSGASHHATELCCLCVR